MAKKAAEIFVDQEICSIIDFCNEHLDEPKWYQPCFYVLSTFCTGMRQNELRTLPVGDCDTRPQPKIWLANGKGSGKGPRGRWIAILPEFRQTYIERIEALKARKPHGRFGPIKWVFVGQKHATAADTRAVDYPSEKSMNNWWRRVMKGAGVRPLTSHDGRRTYICNLIHRDCPAHMDVFDMAAQAGHTLVTMQKYYHVSAPEGRFATDRTFEWLKHVPRRRR